MYDYCTVALSIDYNILKSKLLWSLYNNFDKEYIKKLNVIVICQGFSKDNEIELLNSYNEIKFYFDDKIQDKSISYIRKYFYKKYKIFDSYEYVIIIDDDFILENKSIDQYLSYIEYMRNNKYIGLIACHHRIKKIYREIINEEPDWDYYDGNNLYIISMRTGLICRSIDPNILFNDKVYYHEEMYLAVEYYINGYEIGKGWINVNHKQNNLGKNLERQFNILNDNNSPTAKKILIDNNLYDVGEGYNYYDLSAEQSISDKARLLHNINKKEG